MNDNSKIDPKDLKNILNSFAEIKETSTPLAERNPVVIQAGRPPYEVSKLPEEARGTLLVYFAIRFKPSFMASYPRDNISYIAYIQPQIWHNLTLAYFSATQPIEIPCVLEMFATDRLPDKNIPDHDEENASIVFSPELNPEDQKKTPWCRVELKGIAIVKEEYWFVQMEGISSTHPHAIRIPWRRDKGKFYGLTFNMDYKVNTVHKIDESMLIDESETKQIGVSTEAVVTDCEVEGTQEA
jgi:hypothetical protein